MWESSESSGPVSSESDYDSDLNMHEWISLNCRERMMSLYSFGPYRFFHRRPGRDTKPSNTRINATIRPPSITHSHP